MKKIIISGLIFFIILNNVFSQQTAIWYFGHHAGVEFSNGSVTALSNGQIDNEEGTSVVAGNNGNLLFYTDGVSVWDKNHNIMPNGSGLLGHYSSTQTLVIQKPGECKQFYVFYTDGQFGNQIWRYSIVDLSLNNGLGDVVTASKNTFLYSPGAEKITSVKHSNGADTWIILHGLGYNNNQFLAYLITSSGISSPVISSNVGNYHDNLIGYMKASHDGKKIGLAITFTPDIRADIFDFNNNTGIVSNPYSIGNIAGAYGIEFSPNDSLMYISSYWGTNHLYQVDMSDYSYQVISSANNSNYDYCALQLAPDGKIYMARGNQNYLSVINVPNIKGSGCGFSNTGITLASGTYGFLGLPTFDQSLFNNDNKGIAFSNNCSSYEFNAAVGYLADSLIWDFGDPNSGSMNSSYELNPHHLFSGNGNYVVTLIAYHVCGIDTFTQPLSPEFDSTEIHIPNVFTPNEDGYNDVFEIKNFDFINSSLTIYNRWGKLVYSSKDSGEYWDGKLNNTDCNDGVYFWIMEYPSLCNSNSVRKSVNGFLHLLR